MRTENAEIWSCGGGTQSGAIAALIHKATALAAIDAAMGRISDDRLAGMRDTYKTAPILSSALLELQERRKELDAVAPVKAAARDVLASADAMQWTPPEFLLRYLKVRAEQLAQEVEKL